MPLPKSRPSNPFAPNSSNPSAQVKVRNLTPLDLWVEVEDARRTLRPFDEVVAMRPHDSKFKLEVNGVRLGSLLADPRKDELTIRPDSLSTLEQPQPASSGAASAILENRANVEVSVYRLEPQGKAVLLFKLNRTPGEYYKVSGSAGDIHIVRNSFSGDVLAMFVLGVYEPELEVTITAEFFTRAKGGAPAVAQPIAIDDIWVNNLTPLHVQLHSADKKTIPLEPLAKVKQERPPFGKFAAEVNGVRLGVVEVEPNATELKLQPSHFRSLPQFKSLQEPLTRGTENRMLGGAIAHFLNSTNGAVKIYWRDHSGKDIEKLSLPSGSHHSITNSYPGAVYVVRDSGDDSVAEDEREPRVVAMCVVGEQNLSEDRYYHQALTIAGDYMARQAAVAAGDRPGDEVELSNLTPLDLTLTDASGTEHAIASLGAVKAKRPSTLAFVLKHRGVSVGSAVAAPGTAKATIEPGLLRTESKTSLGPGGLSFWNGVQASKSMINQSGLDIEVYKKESLGQEQLKATANAGGVAFITGEVGDVCVARESSTKELLDMFVLGSDPGPNVFITSAFAAKVARVIKVINLTPLALDLHQSGAEKSAHLDPFDEATLTRHPGGLFGVHHHGVHLRDIRVDPDNAELTIAPGHFRSVPSSGSSRDPVSGAWTSWSHAPSQHSFRNDSGGYVDLLRVDDSGQEVRKLTLDPNPNSQTRLEGYGDVYIARRTFTGELLAMFVLGAPPFNTTVAITTEFSARMAARSLKLPVVPGGRFAVYGEVGSEAHPDRIASVALLGGKRQRPDKRSKEYILISERPVNQKPKPRFNTRKNVDTRSVTITGVELIWSVNDDSYGLMGYQGESVLDIQELEMFADRVVIASALWFPGTNVTIHARELEFQGAGMIKTTPIALPEDRARSPYRTIDGEHPADEHKDPTYQAAAGQHGEPGGAIKLFVGKLKCADSQPKFWTKGSAGQAGELGGLKPYRPKNEKPGQPKDNPDVDYVTKEEIDDLFDSKIGKTKTAGAELEHFTWPGGVHQPNRMCLIKPKVTDFPGKKWKQVKPASAPDGPVVSLKIVACRTDFYAMTNWLWIPDGDAKHEWRDVVISTAVEALQEPYKTKGALFSTQDVTGPTRQRPGDGRDAYPGGRPGDGGAGGSIETNFLVNLQSGMGSWFVMDGGAPGSETPPVPGGKKGKPDPAYWMDVAIFFGDGTPGHRVTNVTAEDGAAADSVRGNPAASGALRQVEGDWMTAEIVDAVIACAQDAYRNGHRDLAMELLDPYYAELRSSRAGAEELQSQFVVIDALRANISRNTDFYGNPPGWIPRLSLTSTLGIFNAVRDVSAELLYFAQTMADRYEKIDQSSRLAEKGQAVVQADISRNRTRLKQAYVELEEARTDLETIGRQVGLKQKEIGRLKMLAEQRALDRVKEQRIFRGVMKAVGGALKLVPVGQPYVGLAADVVSGVGDFDWTNPSNIPDQISGTFGKVGTLTNTFIEENEDLLAADAAGTPRPDKTPALAEQLRLAESAVNAHDKVAADSRKSQLQSWEEANKNELEALKTDQAKLADFEATIKTFEPDEEAQRLMGLIKKKYGDESGGQIAEALLERRQDLVDAANKAKARLDHARNEVEKKALEEAAGKLDKLKNKATDLTEQLARAKYNQAQIDTKFEAKKKQYKDTVGRLKKIGDGVSTIGVGVAALMSQPTTADGDVQNLSAMLLQSQYRADYEKLLEDAQELAGKQARVMAKLNEAQQRISGAAADIAMNMGELDAMSHQRQSLSPVLDVRVKRYLKGMEARARDALRWAIYALIQSYRYENLEDVREELYNIDKLVAQVRQLEAASGSTVATGRVAGEAKLPWPDFKNIDDKVFRNELVQMAVDILMKRQKFERDKENAAPVELSGEQLATLQKTASVTFNLARDFDIGLSFEAIRARIVDVDLNELALTLKSSASIDSIRADFVHSGQSIIRGHDRKYYYFRQAHEQDPISWGFSYALATKAIKKDTKDDQEDLEILTQFLGSGSTAASQLVKLKEYYPSLFSDINLSLKLKNPRDIDMISSVKFTVKYRLAKD